MTIRGTDGADGSSCVRLAEVVAALSLATDLAMGQPLEHALCSCILAVRLGDALGLGDDELHEVYYQALLRYIGCNAETYAVSALVGDEIALRTEYATVDSADQRAVVGIILRYLRQANAGTSPLHFLQTVTHGLLTSSKSFKEIFSGHCEVAQRLATRLGFGERVVDALGQLYERWDGRGLPRGRKGEQVALSVRVVTLAQDAIVFHRIDGVEAAVAMARERRGTVYEPRIVDIFCDQAARLLSDLSDEPSWDTVLRIEPGRHVVLSEPGYDEACRAVADFTDLKSPYFLGHSSGVAQIAAAAARFCRLPTPDVHALGRAALLHDIGRVGVTTSIWDKPGPLSEREWERVRLHPYYTERVLARPAALKRLGVLAACHHERIDGSGYHRGATSTMLSPAARLLAAADVYQACTETRPHRAALPPTAAADVLRREVRLGHLDGDAVAGVLASVGHTPHVRHRERVAGLSEREVAVLRLLARGHSMKTIAAQLVVADKTVDNHIQHIYNKIGVSTRAGATLFAVEHNLLLDAGASSE